MDTARNVVERLILEPRYARYLAVLKAARNGAVYGTKIRFPHALVMIFLFRGGTLQEKIRLILKATKTHARNLALFAVAYKLTMLALQSTPQRNKGEIGIPKEMSYDTFLAGLVGGYFVFGRGIQSSVNQQIVTYIFARVVLGLAKLSVREGGAIPAEYRSKVTENAWPVFAAVSWGAVMWLYRWHDDALLPSLRSSMKYIYSDSDHWTDLRTFVWHNT